VLEFVVCRGWIARGWRSMCQSQRAKELAEKRRLIPVCVWGTSQLLGIEHLLDRLPGWLSGEERQRVALGRAIVRPPAAFLFDEPLLNLDARLRVEMRRQLGICIAGSQPQRFTSLMIRRKPCRWGFVRKISGLWPVKAFLPLIRNETAKRMSAGGEKVLLVE